MARTLLYIRIAMCVSCAAAVRIRAEEVEWQLGRTKIFCR
jgi:hypothetical protein